MAVPSLDAAALSPPAAASVAAIAAASHTVPFLVRAAFFNDVVAGAVESTRCVPTTRYSWTVCGLARDGGVVAGGGAGRLRSRRRWLSHDASASGVGVGRVRARSFFNGFVYAVTRSLVCRCSASVLPPFCHTWPRDHGKRRLEALWGQIGHGFAQHSTLHDACRPAHAAEPRQRRGRTAAELW